MIEVIDYGAGNLRSVVKALEAVGAEVRLCNDPACIDNASGVVFPGQGSFQTSSAMLPELGFLDPLRKYITENRPFLGICLGLQLLFEGSEEAPGAVGVSAFKGINQKFAPGKKIPHMGWNGVEWSGDSPVFRGIPNGTFFYFVHSYFPVPEDPALIAGRTDYQEEFCSAVARGNLAAVQFHPEKSQRAGLQLLTNFVELCQKENC